MKATLWVSRLLCAAMILALVPAGSAQAASRAVSGAIFSVNSNADNTDYDAFLTLREALLAANGTFTRSYSVAERALMSGCTFDVSGNVTGGCGAGNDAIVFKAEVTQITLLSQLPDIVNDGTLIIGSAGKPAIDMKAAGTGDALIVRANNVYLIGLSIYNHSGYSGSLIYFLTGYKGLRVSNNSLGLPAGATSCSDAAITSYPPFIISIQPGTGTAAPGDGTAYIYDNVIGCGNYDGITLEGASYVYIGQDSSGTIRPNYIGVTRSGANIGNFTRGGVYISFQYNQGNVVTGNQIGYCAWSGIHLDLSSSAFLSGNDVHHNGWSGIEVTDSSGNTLSNNNLHDNGQFGILVQGSNSNSLIGNNLHHNAKSGIQVNDSHDNLLNNNLSHHNAGSGILFNQTNPTPQTTIKNVVSGGAAYLNSAAGIAEDAASGINRWSQVSIYGNGGLGIDKNGYGSVDAPPLAVTGVTPAGLSVLVNGTLTVSSAVMTNYQIELYRSDRDPSGYGEGKTYIGSVTLLKNAPGTYNWSIPDSLGAVCYTATLTTIDPINPQIATSSEFSANLGTICNQVYVPTVRR